MGIRRLTPRSAFHHETGHYILNPCFGEQASPALRFRMQSLVATDEMVAVVHR
jgi:hypothetical protein